jgi:hypothetical protein
MRKSILIICGLVLAVCLWLLWHRRTEAPGTGGNEPVAAAVTNQNPAATPKAAVTTPVPSAPAPVAVAPNAPATSAPTAVLPTVTELLQKPINFYGKVIDENSNPVAGVSIKFRWTDLTAPNQERTSSTESYSDGLFSLRDRHGASMTLWFSKAGYYSPHHGQMSFNYAFGPDILSPDPHNPVIFQLRKKGQGAELVTSDNGIQPSLAALVPINGDPVSVNLLQKEVGTSGDLEISQVKPDSSHWQLATNWSFHMSIPAGGFIQEEDAFPFTAPETGYQTTVDLNFVKGEPDWTTQLTKTYYIAFGQPQKYGWLRVEANIAQQTVFLTYAINPTGSRNLEPGN